MLVLFSICTPLMKLSLSFTQFTHCLIYSELNHIDGSRVLDGFYMVSHGSAWYSMALYGTSSFCMVFYGIGGVLVVFRISC